VKKVHGLIATLEEMGDYLELDGANPFKSGAYPKAARALQEFGANLDDYVTGNRLTEIPGVGKGLAEKIVEFWNSGRIAELDELKARIPAGLREMTRIPGVGAKKVRALREALGIATVADLRAACGDGRVAGLKGFGDKTALKILGGIDQLEKFSGRHRLDFADRLAEPILEFLRAHPDVIRAEIAGSLRRSRETVKDLDFVAAVRNAEKVMADFTSLPDVTSIIGSGDTKSSVILGGKIQADLRCVTEAEFPFALMHFTGSKEHNTRMRALAKDAGLKLNEYGLFPEGSETSLPAATEADVYTHFGMEYVAPELREEMGEIEAARERRLPRLVQHSDFRGVIHIHTHYSDGKPALADYAKWAAEHGIQWMGISDHSRSLTVANGLSEERVRQQQAEIDAVNAEFAARGVRLLKGIESDILANGALDYSDGFLKSFEFVIASVHSYFNLTEAEQTTRVLRALEHPATTVLGHMTGRLLLARDGFDIDQKEVIRAAARHGVAIEINANPWRLDIDWRLIRFAVEQGCRLCVGPDAHAMDGLSDTRFGIAMAHKGWLTADDLLNTLSADDFLAFARKEKK